MPKQSRYTNDQTADMTARYTTGETSTSVGSADGLHRAKVHDLLRTRGVPVRTRSQAKRIYQVREDAFHTISDEPSAHRLGFLCADGCVMHRRGSGELQVVLHRRDIPHPQALRVLLGTDAPIRKESANETYRVSAYSAGLAADLVSLVCTPRKSFSRTFPVLLTSQMVRFVRGHFDEDESTFMATNAKGPVLSFGGSESFLAATRQIINQATCAEGGIYRHSPSRCLTYSGAFQVASIAGWPYAGSTVLLERKPEVVRHFPVGKRAGYPTANHYLGTAGNVSSETIRRYIEAQKGQ